MVCKFICEKYRATKPAGSSRYLVGQKRCQTCEIFMKLEGLWCPCCGYRLRTKPRNRTFKKKLKDRIETQHLELASTLPNQ